MNKPIIPVLVAFFLLTTSFSSHLYAIDYTFNACSGDWSDPNNWSPNGVPGASDNVTIYIGCGSGVVTLTENTIVNNLSITGSSTLTGSFDLTVNGNLTFAAQLSTIGNVTVSGTMTWSGGLLGSSSSTTGTITVTGLVTIQGAGGSLYKKNLTANGGINHTAGSIGMALGSVITIPVGQSYQNSTPSGAYIINYGSGGVINMLGTFQRTASGGFEIKQDITFNNSGTVQLNSGTLDLNGGGTHTGAFSVDNGTTLSFGTGTHNMNGATFSGTGEIKQTGGTINLNSGTGSFGKLNITGGTFNSSVDVTVSDNMTITSSTLTGTFNLTVNGNLTFRAALSTIGDMTVNEALTWNGGSLGQNGTTTGTITVSGLVTLQSDARALHKKVLTANGGINHTGYDTYMTSGAVINVSAGQTYQSSTPDGAKITNLGGGGTINIIGTFQRSVTGGFTFGSSIDVNNSGTVRVDVGSVTFTGTFNNNGLLKGTGTLNFDGTFVQNGSISPGNSPGELTIVRSTLTNSILEIELASAAGPGTGHDRLNVVGNFVASGTLNVTLLGMYDPIPNTSFQIVAATGTVSGTFTTINYPPGGNWSLTYNSNNVTLEYLGLLPVELMDFDAQASNSDVLLSWRTASEINNDHFEVGHSRDGINFEPIGKVTGHGTTLEEREYQFVHRQPEAGTHYYRLRQVDLDGQHEFSKTISIAFGSMDAFRIYPNPSQGILKVEGDNLDGATFTVSNLLGETMHLGFVLNANEIDISALPAGQYVLVIHAKGRVMAEKVWKE